MDVRWTLKQSCVLTENTLKTFKAQNTNSLRNFHRNKKQIEIWLKYILKPKFENIGKLPQLRTRKIQTLRI